MCVEIGTFICETSSVLLVLINDFFFRKMFRVSTLCEEIKRERVYYRCDLIKHVQLIFFCDFDILQMILFMMAVLSSYQFTLLV